MDIFRLAALGLLFLGLATVSGVFVLGLLRYRRELPRLFRVLSGITLLGVLGSVVTFAMMPPGYDPAEIERIEQIRTHFASTLEEYRARQGGAYPPSLEAVGIQTPQTRYGPLRYHAGVEPDGGAYYMISVGDYFHNGFAAWWDSRKPDDGWYVDT